MLGAKDVSEAAGAVLSALRSDGSSDRISSLCKLLVDDLLGLASHIRLAVDTTEVVKEKVEPAHVAEVLAHLKDFLEHGNMDASELALKEGPLLRAAFGEKARSMLAHIEDFDYEAAAVELRQLQGVFKQRDTPPPTSVRSPIS